MKTGSNPAFNDIRLSIVAVAIVLTSIPTLAAFYSVQGILDSAVAIGLTPEVGRELDGAGRRLKELARLVPSREPEYRSDFDRLQSVRRDYGLLLETRSAVHRSLFQVFSIIFGFSLAIAIALAWLLNRRILRAYDHAIAKMSAAEHRAAYLETRESWSVVAQKMVHEVKNPLTPVQVMVGRLRRKYADLLGTTGPDQAFLGVLEETDQMVQEEVGKINAWVEAFARFARIPEPVLALVGMRGFVDETILQFSEYWEAHSFRWKDRPDQDATVLLDPRLFRQVLFNLSKNSIESAGNSRQITVWFSLREGPLDTLVMEVADDGPGIPSEKALKLFQPFQTTKSEGMGLGLAICRRIMSDLRGGIRLLPAKEARNGTTFELTLPRNAQGGNP